MFQDASLADETQRRYLHYALSVIQSRALPDVRDGLKPVQRRILYAMANELHLRPDAKYRKSAAVVGDVMGKFHPHGDTAIYDALARMAQPFSLRAPLVDGRGNFGSADGDAPAAMRYTECKLAPVAMELLSELGKKTVAFRPNFDGTKFEPVVLPARFPNLLVNGAQGIAVGMATSIPPHNLGEVTDACVALIDDPELPLKSILKFVKGPDFPTGGQLVSSRAEIQAVYETGQGSLRLRGEYKTEEPKKGNPLIVITSIPYAIERRAIVEKIAEVILDKKLPILLDVRDESTDETRIVCEYKREADPALVMAYLYKHTPLAVNVQVNLTCLVPTDHAEIQAPERLDLGAMLRHFLRFRMEVVTKRLEFDLAELQRRIHILEGFATIFDALDETIRIIRKSDGKRDAAEKLIKRFSLDEEQVDAILEMRLYKLAQLEIRLIREELEEKRKEAARLSSLLKNEAARWKLIRAELLETRTQFGDRRRTRVSSGEQEPQFDAEAFIVDEDQFVLLTQQGWIKRQRDVKDLGTTRVREGDAVMSVAHGSTKASIAFFSNFGACFVCRIVDIPATTGYGDPIGKLFKLEDKERIVAMMSFDPRALQVPPAIEGGEPEPPFAVAVTKDGFASRFSLRPHREPSTRAGRRYMRVSEGSEILYVGVVSPDQVLGCASVASHVLLVNSEEIPVLSGPGKGVILMKLSEGDALIGARLLFDDRDAFEVENESGKTFSVGPRKYEVGARASKGYALFKRGSLVRFLMPEPAIPTVVEN